jgi:hypothetical protein
MVLDSEREQEREEMWDATLEDEDRYQKEEVHFKFLLLNGTCTNVICANRKKKSARQVCRR